MSDDEDEDKQLEADVVVPPPMHTIGGPSQNQPVPGHFSLLKRQPQRSEAIVTPVVMAVKTSAAATKNTRNDGESTTSSDKTDSSFKGAGAGKGSRSHARQDRHHPGERSQMELMKYCDHFHCCNVVLSRLKKPIPKICNMLCLAILSM